MLGMRRFFRDERGATFEGIALSVSVIAITCVATADLLNYMNKRGEMPRTALVQESKSLLNVARGGLPRQRSTQSSLDNADIDYMATGAIPALRQRSVLDPCTGQTK